MDTSLRKFVAARSWALAAAVFSVGAALVASPPEPPSEQGCRCETIKRTDGWCETCSVGFVAGVRIESRRFFDALDAHGHTIDPKTLVCETCKKNYRAGGFCEECRFGFVDRQAYFSKLTYYIAKGKIVQAGKTECTKCVENAKSPGWCDGCGLGTVGGRTYNVRKDFEEAMRLRNALILAIPKAKECLPCALAMVNDGACAVCRKSYRDGKPVTPTDAEP